MTQITCSWTNVTTHFKPRKTGANGGPKMAANLNVFKYFYYMAVSHKDWELPNSRIWLAEIYIDRGLDFPI